MLVRFDHVASSIVNPNHSILCAMRWKPLGILFSLSKLGSINRDFVFGISVMEAHVIVVA
jgi:hypothetical protein